jgi:hypothetical protein
MLCIASQVNIGIISLVISGMAVIITIISVVFTRCQSKKIIQLSYVKGFSVPVIVGDVMMKDGDSKNSVNDSRPDITLIELKKDIKIYNSAHLIFSLSTESDFPISEISVSLDETNFSTSPIYFSRNNKANLEIVLPSQITSNAMYIRKDTRRVFIVFRNILNMKTYAELKFDFMPKEFANNQGNICQYQFVIKNIADHSDGHIKQIKAHKVVTHCNEKNGELIK